MVLAGKKEAAKGGIIVCFNDNNNQSDTSFQLREAIHKFLKTLAPKLTPDYAHWL